MQYLPGLLQPEPLSPWWSLLISASIGDTQILNGMSGSVSYGISGSWWAQCFVWALWGSLASMRFHSKHDFIPLIVFLGLILCPWMLGIFFWWPPTFSCWWLFISELQIWCSHKRWVHLPYVAVDTGVGGQCLVGCFWVIPRLWGIISLGRRHESLLPSRCSREASLHDHCKNHSFARWTFVTK